MKTQTLVARPSGDAARIELMVQERTRIMRRAGKSESLRQSRHARHDSKPLNSPECYGISSKPDQS